MAKKKFLNLDNMNILWDNIDRNFLRREDIPYTEFEELLTDNHTIIGALNELYRILLQGVPSVQPTISCGVSSISQDYQYSSKSVTATYSNYTTINNPVVSGGNGWLTVTSSGTGAARMYNIVMTENTGDSRSATITLSCIGKNNARAEHVISISQGSMPGASINTSSIPTSLPDAGVFSGSYQVIYENAKTIETPTSSASWLVISKSNQSGDIVTYNISATKNESSARSATITFKCIGLNNKTVTKQITITQPAANIVPDSISVSPSSWTSISENGASKSFTITCNTSWNISDKPSWITASKSNGNGNGTISLTASVNDDTTSRNGVIKLVAGTASANISVSQNAAEIVPDSISVSPSSWTSISENGASKSFTITCNTSWNISDKPEWITVSKTNGNGNDTISLTAAINDDPTSRNGVVKLVAGTASANISVSQNAAEIEVETLQMYIGYIPYDSSKFTPEQWVGSGYGLITEQMVKNGISNGNIKKSDAKEVTTDYTGFGSVPEYSLLFIALPKSAGLKANKWNIIEGDVVFSVNPTSNGAVELSIDGDQYQLYGEMTPYNLIQNEKEVYYKIKSGAPSVVVDSMYIGYIPRNGMSSFAEITPDMVLNGVSKGTITKSDAKSVTADYTGFGDVPAKSFLLIALPQSSGLKASTWNIIEGDMPFSVSPMSNGDNNININGKQYQLYGEYAKYELIKGSEEVYYKIK